MTSFIPVRLLGTSFSLKTEETPEYLQEIIKSYEEKLEEIKTNVGVSDPLKLAILSGIILTEELKKEREQKVPSGHFEARDEMEKVAQKLIHYIDSVL